MRVCAARSDNVGHAVVEQVSGPHLGIRVDQHPVGGLPLAGMTRDRVLIHAHTELGAKGLLNNRMAYVAVSRGAYDAQMDR